MSIRGGKADLQNDQTSDFDPLAELIAFKGERPQTLVSFRHTFECLTLTYVQLSR